MASHIKDLTDFINAGKEIYDDKIEIRRYAEAEYEKYLKRIEKEEEREEKKRKEEEEEEEERENKKRKLTLLYFGRPPGRTVETNPLQTSLSCIALLSSLPFTKHNINIYGQTRPITSQCCRCIMN